jgi:LytS/YehU family sensor histidine kinase
MLEIKAIERKITDLQLKNFRNQLDPHFTFNALNVIGSVIYKEDRDVAYDYFTRFSRLMRSSLMDSTKITRELEAELQFTLDYLEFQKYRFKDKFEFSIDVDEGIDIKMQVPKMLIQGYVENAIRHGFHLIKYKGIISIRLSRANTGFLISIKDNGIGREESARLNPNKQIGRGMNIMEEQVSLFNKYNPNSIVLKIIDLKNGGKAAGTLIEILIPDNYSFSISKPNR